MKTAVEWFFEQIMYADVDIKVWREIYDQAKKMDREQIIEAYRDGRSDQQSDRQSRFYNRMAEQYYNETFKK